MTTHKKYPLQLRSVPKEILWGGSRLKQDYNKTAPFSHIAESWELTIRNDGENTVINGPFRGQFLSDVIASDRIGYIGTESAGMERFPLLIKFIDARDDLSVQVHPNDEYALCKENEFGKTEMWYIVEADEGAKIVLGLKEGCTISEFAEDLHNGCAETHLNTVKVKQGDVFFIPPGMIHAIGGGILIAEIQQNSNVTYRVYDYNRKQADGSLRPLHIKKALDVIRPVDPCLSLTEASCDDPTLLCSCNYFKVRKFNDTYSIFRVSDRSFAHLLVLDSHDAALECGAESYTIKKGDSWFLPAGIGKTIIRGRCEFLLTTMV